MSTKSKSIKSTTGGSRKAARNLQRFILTATFTSDGGSLEGDEILGALNPSTVDSQDSLFFTDAGLAVQVCARLNEQVETDARIEVREWDEEVEAEYGPWPEPTAEANPVSLPEEGV